MHSPSRLVMFCIILAFVRVSRSVLVSENLVRGRDGITLTKEPLKTVKVRSKLQCPIKCVESEDCGFALFNSAQKSCKLYKDREGETIAEDGWISWRIPAPPTDCDDIRMDNPTAPDGVYVVSPLDGAGDVSVFCDMTDDGGGWTVLQRRQDGSVNFDRTWEAYNDGFGSLENEFWLGNNLIWRLTNQRTYEIKIDLEDWNNEKRFASYSDFHVNGETDNFRLHYNNYTGNAGDSLGDNRNHHECRFSTKDKDNDYLSVNCAGDRSSGGWWCHSWYNNVNLCLDSNLNGIYNSTEKDKGVIWGTFRGYYESMKYTAMKIRRP